MSVLRQKIAPAFKKVAQGAGILALAAATAIHVTGRPLQGGERDVAEDIFGGQMNADSVRLHYMPFKLAETTGMALFNHVFFFGAKDPGDFTAGGPASTPVHELAHVWQYQNWLISPRSFCQTYGYTLAEDSKFSDFCIEQQASMVTSYYMRFLCDDPAGRRSEPPTRLDTLLQTTVEAQFPRARETRLALENGAEAEKRTALASAAVPLRAMCR